MPKRTRGIANITGIILLLCNHNALAIEATYKLVEDGHTALLKVNPSDTLDPIAISADCRTSNRRYFFEHLDKKTKSNFRRRTFLIYVSDKHYYKSGPIDEKTLIELSPNLQIGKPQNSLKRPPILDLDQERIGSLIDLCSSKYKAYASGARQKARAAANKRSDLIDKVRSLHNVEPMFNGENQMRIDDLVTEFLNYGYSEKVGKFVWFYDGTYRVDQVLEGGVILKSNSYTGLLPITIFTEKKALENQRWSAVSGSPLKFIGVDSYDTVIGTKQQTLLFEHLWKNSQR